MYVACVRCRASIVVHIVCESCRNYTTETLVAVEFLCWCWVSSGLFTNPPILLFTSEQWRVFLSESCWSWSWRMSKAKLLFLKEVQRRKEWRCPCSFLQSNSRMVASLSEMRCYQADQSQLLRSASPRCVVTFLRRSTSGYGVGLCIGYTSMRRLWHSFEAESKLCHIFIILNIP